MKKFWTLVIMFLITVQMSAFAAENSYMNTGFTGKALAKRVENAVVMYVNNSEGYINNIREKIDVSNQKIKLFVKNDVVYIPLRFSTFAIGDEVEYKDNCLEMANLGIKLFESSSQYLKNEVQYKLSSPIINEQDRIFISLKDFADMTGKECFYHDGMIVISNIKNIFDIEKDADLLYEMKNNLSYEWGNVYLGANGFVSGLVIHPNEPDVIYARTDVGGAYKWDVNSKTWIPMTDSFSEELTNFYGVDGIATAATNSDVVYISCGTYSTRQPHGLLKSINGGKSWETLDFNKVCTGNDGSGAEDARIAGEPIAIDPNNEDIVYIGTREEGLWRTFDGGKTFEKVMDVPNAEKLTGVRCVMFDPNSEVIDGKTQGIYAGVRGKGIYYSSDGGASFKAIEGSPSRPRRMKLEDDILYVTAGTILPSNAVNTEPDAGVFKYINGKWKDITPVKGRGFHALAVSPTDSNVLFCMEQVWHFNPIYKSTDGGKSWSQVAQHLMASTMEFNPHKPEQMFLACGFGVTTCDDVNAKTLEYYHNDKGIEELCMIDVFPMPKGPKLIVGNMDKGGFTSEDMTEVAQRLVDPATSEMNSIDFCEENPLLAYRLSSQGYGAQGFFSRSTDGGRTWENVTDWVGHNGGGQIAVSPTLQENGYPVLVIITPAQTPIRSVDNGQTWQEVNGIPPFFKEWWHYQYKVLASDRVDGDVFYILDYTTGDFYLSIDAGATFEKTAKLNLQYITDEFVQLKSAPGMRGTVWISNNDNGVYYSENFGKTWGTLQDINRGKIIAFGKNKEGNTHPTAFLYGKYKGVSGIFKSDDMGTSWVRINDDAHKITDLTNSMAGDRRVYGKVYIGTSGRGVFYGQPIGTDDVRPRITLSSQSSSEIQDAEYAVIDKKFTVYGSVDELCEIRVNGVKTKVALDGNFNQTVILKEGENKIIVEGKDASGNYASPKEIMVRCLPNYLGISLTNQGNISKTEKYILEGTVNKACTVKINGENVPVVNNRFSKEYSLKNGENQFEIVAQSDDGAKSNAIEKSITYDKNPPNIQIDKIDDVTNEPFLILDGTADKKCEIRVNGKIINTRHDLTFSTFLALKKGQNNILIEARDGGGNVAQPRTYTIAYKPNVATNTISNEKAVEKIQGNIEFDGIINEMNWKLDSILTKVGEGNPNNIVKFGSVWDEENLYVGVMVLDEKIVTDSSDPFQDDCVEIFIDANLSRLDKYNEFSRQFVFRYGLENVYSSQNAKGVEFKTSDIDGGYQMEIKIPWVNLGVKPESGLQIGFDIDNVDDDGNSSGNRDGVILWNGTMNNWQRTDVYGTLILK